MSEILTRKGSDLLGLTLPLHANPTCRSLINMSDDMTDKFRLFCRASGVWYIEDKQSHEQESLRTRDVTEAKRLFNAKNEAQRQPAINIQIARAYLTATDPMLVTRTWNDVMQTLIKQKEGSNYERWELIKTCFLFESDSV